MTNPTITVTDAAGVARQLFPAPEVDALDDDVDVFFDAYESKEDRVAVKIQALGRGYITRQAILKNDDNSLLQAVCQKVIDSKKSRIRRLFEGSLGIIVLRTIEALEIAFKAIGKAPAAATKSFSKAHKEATGQPITRQIRVYGDTVVNSISKIASTTGEILQVGIQAGRDSAGLIDEVYDTKLKNTIDDLEKQLLQLPANLTELPLVQNIRNQITNLKSNVNPQNYPETVASIISGLLALGASYTGVSCVVYIPIITALRGFLVNKISEGADPEKALNKTYDRIIGLAVTAALGGAVGGITGLLEQAGLQGYSQLINTTKHGEKINAVVLGLALINSGVDWKVALGLSIIAAFPDETITLAKIVKQRVNSFRHPLEALAKLPMAFINSLKTMKQALVNGNFKEFFARLAAFVAPIAIGALLFLFPPVSLVWCIVIACVLTLIVMPSLVELCDNKWPETINYVKYLNSLKKEKATERLTFEEFKKTSQVLRLIPNANALLDQKK